MNDSEKPKSSWLERRQTIKHKWLVLFIFPEWFCERLSYLLGRWAFLDILGHVGRLTILIAVIFYFMEADERRMESENQRKAKHYQAWQVINAAHGKPGSGGRRDALQDLNSDGISLAGVDISKAYLPKLNLENADLSGANLTGADLLGANLTGAELPYANLTEVILPDSNLTGAILLGANLTGAILSDANLAGAELWEANLNEAFLSGANLTGAILKGAYLADASLFRANLAGALLTDANLAGASIYSANLAGANLRGANFKDIGDWQTIESIESANIYGVKNPPDGFIEWAIEHGAVSIKNDKEWKKLLSEKRQEKTKEKY